MDHHQLHGGQELNGEQELDGGQELDGRQEVDIRQEVDGGQEPDGGQELDVGQEVDPLRLAAVPLITPGVTRANNQVQIRRGNIEIWRFGGMEASCRRTVRRKLLDPAAQATPPRRRVRPICLGPEPSE